MSTSGARPARVLVIGLDMGDGRLVQCWGRQGRLPHFAELTSSGSWIELDTTAEVLHTSTWPTFATGTLPGRHGVYYPYQPKPGYQLARHIRADAYGTPTFWKMANEDSRRCVVFDVPETFPEPGFNGRAIFDWGTWAWYGKPAAQPRSLLGELRSRCGPYPLGLEAKRLGLAVPEDIERRLLRSVGYKAAAAQWLLRRTEWDLAVIGFCETHPAGHYLWPDGVEGIDSADARLFDPLFNVYAALDEALGTLRDALPSDAVMIVVSGDGVRPNRCGWHLLPGVLNRLGYASSLEGQAAPDRGTDRSASVGGRLRRLVPEDTRRRIAAALPWRLRDQLGFWMQHSGIDWSRTRAFTLPTDLEGCIRINVKGREPHGIVEPGSEYVELCQEIRSRLEELVNPAIDAAAVRRVWIRNEVYPGPRQEHLPDLIVSWNDVAPLEAVASSRCGVVRGINPDPRTGTHSTAGFMVAAGRDVPKGRGGRAHLTDVAATVLSLLRVNESARLDGRPVETLVRAAV